ncbi:hypothetical protein EDD53_0617 [Pacificibacter maritimus]|uniref:Uncharacterized protein n=1 Tax=Pacificibacter maritimus TaxID=762213 RepID=A0A3N4V334_9RHOB|nr:hypothetical protein [Pacificibacter maritimus]RPE71497.1 hypothetical protein EDD53_0617 [Pacificibacter maritimus]
MHKYIVPSLIATASTAGVLGYVYFANQANRKNETPNAFNCQADLKCENSADNCTAFGAPLTFRRGDDFDGVMQFDFGPNLTGKVTGVAGQLSGEFAQNDGTTLDLEIYYEGDFTLMKRTPDIGGKTKETYYQGSCERVN